ncbi:MAG: hypothetical protein LBK55_02910 [Azoarcus sp.]|jgi:hypothetical protein|nr:hypothetical protein [Azoarcus sp.]
MKKFLLFFLILSVSTLLALVLSVLVVFVKMDCEMGCGTRQNDELLIEKVVGNMEVGSVVRLADTGIDLVESVCALHPYAIGISNEYAESVKINKYLLDSKYQASEGRWALAMVKGDVIKLLTFKRRNIHLTHNSSKTVFPDDFEHKACAPFKQAALFKSSFDNHPEFFFGRLK